MSQLILGVHSGSHDAAAAVFDGYELKAAVSLERLTRHKGDGAYPDLAIDEVLSIAGVTRKDVDVVCHSRTLMPTKYFRQLSGFDWLKEQYRTHLRGKTRRQMMPELYRHGTADVDRFYDTAALLRDKGFRDGTRSFFYNHHEAHALPALFYSPGWDDALLVTADGGGDNVHYSHRHFANGVLTDIYGGEDTILTRPVEDSLGKMYGAATKALGFRRVRHEGKVTGLSAMGKPVRAAELAAKFSVDANGRVHSTLASDREIFSFMQQLLKGLSKEDYSASVQQVLEDTMLASFERLLAKYPAKHVGVSGGVFANVKLNRLIAEKFGLEEVFIFPAMGDDGLPVGGALAFLLRRDGLATWLKNRRDLGPVYLGRDYTDTVDAALAAIPNVKRTEEAPVAGSVQRLVAGQLGAIYTGRMEFGPRALGNRTILANPSRRETHDLLNERLSRSEFMPFAPVATAERAGDVFDITKVNARACRYMTIATDVRPDWRRRIAAVVHVDQSARPQVIERADNPLYHDILTAFEGATGLAALVNTSFNVHEEPIVNTPSECARALTDGRIDFVVTDRALYVRG
ncbi:carbamoyltransferase C-terminal domain-containing protein [Pseudorhodoplanes sp.]|uniref:carbamoyltransferase C-terminal domain-containing protein n=1 Tax=Pseudorhodoplanes sp. TaxID=1934341 RepID=UPI002CD63537|nr:carbamoyltransferase C-terminal domain-containing protein [Pseudorhodoplanes sp.]HWV44211.1 carbamoyltransferase C-terminal domain-containing protein [Pseudorhodoplanes sp.]